MMKFTGGKDNRKAPAGSEKTAADSLDALSKKKILSTHVMKEGTFSLSSMTMNPADNTWSVTERGGHQFRHSRASVTTEAKGTFTVSDDKKTYNFKILEFKHFNTDRRATEKEDQTGTVITRSADEINSGNFKSFFFDIALQPEGAKQQAGSDSD